MENGEKKRKKERGVVSLKKAILEWNVEGERERERDRRRRMRTRLALSSSMTPSSFVRPDIKPRTRKHACMHARQCSRSFMGVGRQDSGLARGLCHFFIASYNRGVTPSRRRAIATRNPLPTASSWPRSLACLLQIKSPCRAGGDKDTCRMDVPRRISIKIMVYTHFRPR